MFFDTILSKNIEGLRSRTEKLLRKNRQAERPLQGEGSKTRVFPARPASMPAAETTLKPLIYDGFYHIMTTAKPESQVA